MTVGHPDARPAGSAGRFVAAARAADVPPDSAATVDVAGRRITLVNHGGCFYALDEACSHAGGPLGEGRVGGDCLLACAWHGAVFDVRSGQVRRGPARKPLRTYQVKVSAGDVLVAV